MGESILVGVPAYPSPFAVEGEGEEDGALWAPAAVCSGMDADRLTVPAALPFSEEGLAT